LTCSAASRPGSARPRRPGAALPVLVPALLLALALGACASGGGGARPGIEHSLAELTNPALGIDYAQWLIGPVSFLATQEEVAAYLALKDDKAAEAFIQGFWARRNPHPKRPDNSLLETFEERGAEADRLYSEAGFLGRRTDRGTIFVLYGPPTTVDFEVPASGTTPIEVWTYAADAAPGLTGRQPSPRYRFSKHGDLTVFYVPGRIGSRSRRGPGGFL
jgi:GWxTD domain-containing protein